MHTEDCVMRLLDWFAVNARDLPWRRTTDPYAIWISEVMLQQTQVKTVIPYWERWMKRLPGVAQLAAAPEADVLKLWEGLGYYRRARNLHAAAKRIMERHGGVFPTETAKILELPGVGRYTAGAIASIAYNRPTAILDGNVIRVLTRLQALPGDPAGSELSRRLWDDARALVASADDTGRPNACSHLNQALMELGAIVCLPSEPRCDQCPVAEFCQARLGGAVESYPQTKVAAPPTPLHYMVILASNGPRWCVRQRPADGVNGGLWEFPNIQVEDASADPSRVVRRLFGAGRWLPSYFATVRHAITRYKVTQHVHRLRLPLLSLRARRAGEWMTLEQMETLAFSSAHRRLVDRLRDDHDSTH
jgi:A/G-specific adenine glycosylase